MPVTFDGKLVVAISSRALFDFEEENRVFDRDGETAYVALQLGRIDVPAKQGVAFPLVKKLLAFNTPDAQRVEVVILSKNDPVSGLRVFRSAQRAGLIRYSRGRIEVLDRPGLEKAVCECYSVVKIEFDRLLADIPRGDPYHALGQSAA